MSLFIIGVIQVVSGKLSQFKVVLPPHQKHICIILFIFNIVILYSNNCIGAT